jgi:hypothetical protein
LTTNDPSKQNQEDSGGLSMDNSGAENHTTIFTIAESPLNDQVIWVGTDDGNVQVTRNGGKTWTNTVANVPNLPANTWTYHIEASVFDAGTAYVVFDGHTQNDMTTYVYKTTDYGASWKSIVTDDIKGFARNIQEDLVSPNLLFLGTEFGLYISMNGGETWLKFTNNMPSVAVHFIDLHPRTNDLVMGTHGRGVIIIDDISPLRDLTPEILNKNVHLFDIKPTVINEKSDFGGNFGTETQFVGANPSRDVQIKYYLSKRHTFGKMSIEIQDASGNKVGEVGPGKKKGINIVTWDYRLKPPKVAKGKTITFGGFTSPKAAPGNYKMFMTKGSDTFEQPFDLILDDKLPMQPSDYKERDRVSQLLFDMSEFLAYMVYQLDAMIDHESGNKSSKILNSMNALKETLVITTGDNYVGAAEPQLREKIATLFSKIATSYDKPSANDMENFDRLTKLMTEANSSFESLKKKFKSYDQLELKDKASFLDTTN